MKTIRSFPRRVREIEHTWIPLPDGGRLAARIWIPEGAGPVPAVLEYIPYGKRLGTRERDERMHPYFAGHGYAAVRVDLRGSGESDGLLRDEYLEQELLDGLETIRWIASRSWCDGSVAMIGKSWGGFNALQIAALRPPALRAVVSVCSTDDRYADDAHYMGGCLLNENLIWGSTLFTLAAQPPDPDLVGERWRDAWRHRLESCRPVVETWLRHPRRDDYWKHGSVCEDYSKIACPVLLVGGWADGYSNAVPRMLAGLDVPRQGIVGPWGHQYPHQGVPGPAIGFLQEVVTWWDRWLGAPDPAGGDDPRYRVWMQESVPPRPFHATRPGRWIAEPRWPSPRIRTRTLHLDGSGLCEEAPSRETTRVLRPHLTTGLAAGAWCSFGIEGEMPLDQRDDDAGSLVFDTAPLADRLEILGAPEVSLGLEVDRPAAFVCARLCDVAPDGASARVTYGLLNLCSTRGFERPRALRPGERLEARLSLNDVAHAFPAGHRIRLAISTSYWPMVWPSPEPVTLRVFPGASRLELPERPPAESDATLRPFPPPESAAASPVVDLHPGGARRTLYRDETTGETLYTVELDLDDEGRPALGRAGSIRLLFGHSIVERFRIRDDDPATARAEVTHETYRRRGDWQVSIQTRSTLSSTRDTFRTESELRAREGDAVVFERRFEAEIPRDHL